MLSRKLCPRMGTFLDALLFRSFVYFLEFLLFLRRNREKERQKERRMERRRERQKRTAKEMAKGTKKGKAKGTTKGTAIGTAKGSVKVMSKGTAILEQSCGVSTTNLEAET